MTNIKKAKEKPNPRKQIYKELHKCKSISDLINWLEKNV